VYDKQSAPTGSTRFTDPKDYLLSVVNDCAAPATDRIDAAATLMPYFHAEFDEESPLLPMAQEDS
jgi:hypothetical protein